MVHYRSYKGFEAASKYFTDIDAYRFQPVWILPYDEFETQYLKTKGFAALIAHINDSSEQTAELQGEKEDDIGHGIEKSPIIETVKTDVPRLNIVDEEIVVFEPWKKSPRKKQDRDKAIWESREAGDTWEDVAEAAECGVTTAKENYFRMKKFQKSISG